MTWIKQGTGLGDHLHLWPLWFLLKAHLNSDVNKNINDYIDSSSQPRWLIIDAIKKAQIIKRGGGGGHI